jgi:hypothetical protein
VGATAPTLLSHDTGVEDSPLLPVNHGLATTASASSPNQAHTLSNAVSNVRPIPDVQQASIQIVVSTAATESAVMPGQQTSFLVQPAQSRPSQARTRAPMAHDAGAASTGVAPAMSDRAPLFRRFTPLTSAELARSHPGGSPSTSAKPATMSINVTGLNEHSTPAKVDPHSVDLLLESDQL